MPTIYELAIRPALTSVGLGPIQADGTAAPSEFAGGIVVNFGGGFTNPPTIVTVLVPDYTQIVVKGSVYAGPGTHTGSDWEVTTEADTTFSSPVLSSYDDASNLLSITFNTDDLTHDAVYLARTRQTDSTVGDSEWSAAYSFVNSPFQANEPTGMTTITDRLFQATLEGGWWGNGNWSSGNIFTDATAPSGDSSVGRVLFPEGAQDNTFQPAATGYSFPTRYAEIDISMWHKISSNWEWHPTGNNKTIRVRDNSGDCDGGSIPFELDVTNPSGETYIYQGFTGNGECGVSQRYLTNNVTEQRVTRGDWALVELIFRHQSTPATSDGEYHQWVDGVKTSAFTDVEWLNTGDNLWSSIKWDPIWGGNVGATVDADMYQYIDQLYVSGK